MANSAPRYHAGMFGETCFMKRHVIRDWRDLSYRKDRNTYSCKACNREAYARANCKRYGYSAPDERPRWATGAKPVRDVTGGR